ncbi:MAG: hypothetical protein HON90_01920 [Halobacteriovoraceae bacterium]|jgi:carbonic anhydrase|nr:hypothetical protein [Halobacteriovoraceae bacterium]
MANFSQDKVVQSLITGNKTFKTSYGEGTKSQDFLKGQSPAVALVTCSDARVVPEAIFNLKIGEIFCIEIAGNVFSTEVCASVEYAVASLGVSHVVVMGHQCCGAVGAALEGNIDKHSSSIQTLLKRIQPTIAKVKLENKNMHSHDLVEVSIKENAKTTLSLLKENSPILKQSHANGSCAFLAAYYSLETGEVEFL